MEVFSFKEELLLIKNQPDFLPWDIQKVRRKQIVINVTFYICTFSRDYWFSFSFKEEELLIRNKPDFLQWEIEKSPEEEPTQKWHFIFALF